jgi:hypothetical protein
MNSILNNLNNKEISPNSLNLYTKNLMRLNDGKEIKNFTFLKNVDTILDKIKEYKPNTQRTYLISIVSLLKQEVKFKKLYDQYYTILDQYNKNLKNNTEKSEVQVENWISQEDVIKKQQELMSILKEIDGKSKITADQYYKLFDLLILSLYTLNSPRRNLDYLKMNVISKYSDDLPTDNNYLDLPNKQFIFRNYKTKKIYTDQVVPINDDLFSIIKVFLKYHPLKKMMKGKYNVPLLVNYTEQSLKNSNEITRTLNKIFGKKIGSSMLRNIFLTSKYGDDMQQLQQDTTAMGTSVNTAKDNYIKTNSHVVNLM